MIGASPGLGATLRHEWGTRTHGSPISAHHRHPPHHLFETRSGCLVPRRCLENAQGAATTLAFGFVTCRTALEDHRLGLEERKQPFGSPSRPIPDCLKPPNAIVKSVRNALWPTVPERSCRATSRARSTSLVNTEAFNP